MIRKLATTLALAVLVTGCGSDGGGRLSKAEYEQKMQEIADDLRPVGSTLSNLDQTGGDLNELADRVATVSEPLEDAADEVDDLNPPENAQMETRQLADALHALARTFDRIEEAARGGKLQELQQAQQALLENVADAQRATQALEQKGYDVEAGSSD